jgi:hypothetical protein
MRAGYGVVAGSLVLALVFAASLPARPPEGSKVKVTTNSNADLNAISRPGSAVQSTPVGSSNLTAAECTALGGNVHDALPGVCLSGRFCAVTDNRGYKHAVCLKSE